MKMLSTLVGKALAEEIVYRSAQHTVEAEEWAQFDSQFVVYPLGESTAANPAS